MNPRKTILLSLLIFSLFVWGIGYSLADDIQSAENSKGFKISSEKTTIEMPEPWGSLVDDIVRRYPWYGGFNPSYTLPSGINNSELKNAFTNIPTEKLILFLEHPVKYVRDYAKSALSRDHDWLTIVRAYDNASPRIKFELYNIVNKDSYRTWSDPVKQIELLTAILKDPSGKIYGSDVSSLTNYNSYVREEDKRVDLFDVYLRLLESEFIMDRIDALNNLIMYKDNADKIIPILISFIERENEFPPEMPNKPPTMSRIMSQRATACHIAGLFGEKAKDAIPPLRKALRDSDFTVRVCASVALYQIGYEPEAQREYIASLITETKSVESLSLLLDSIKTIGKIPESSIQKLIELTQNDDPTIRQKARTAIASSIDFDECVDIWIANLKSPDPVIRVEAVKEIGNRLSSKKSDLKQYVIDALDDPDISVKSTACYYLIKRELAGPFILPHIIEILSSDQTSVYDRDFIKEIKKLGELGKETVPALLNSLKKGDSDLLREKIETILALGGSQDEIIEKLIEIIKSGDSRAAENAISQLIQFGGRAVAALPALSDYIGNIPDKIGGKHDYQKHPKTKSDLEVIRRQILNSVKPGQKLPKPALYGMMKSSSETEIKNAINMLIWSNESWDNIILHMKVMLTLENSDIRRAALNVTSNLGNLAVSLIPYLANLAEVAKKNHKEYSVYYKAIKKIIEDIEPSDKDSVPHLIQAIGIYDSYPYISEAAINKIIAISGDYDLIVDRLLEIINDDRIDKGSNVHHNAMSDLRRIGFRSKKVLPALRKLIEQGDHFATSNIYQMFNDMPYDIQEKISKDELLDILDLVSGSDTMQKICDLYIAKGGTYDKLAVRLAEVVGSKHQFISSTAHSMLFNMKEKAEAALPKLKELYQSSELDAKAKRNLQMLIERIQMAIETAKKNK